MLIHTKNYQFHYKNQIGPHIIRKEMAHINLKEIVVWVEFQLINICKSDSTCGLIFHSKCLSQLFVNINSSAVSKICKIRKK